MNSKKQDIVTRSDIESFKLFSWWLKTYLPEDMIYEIGCFVFGERNIIPAYNLNNEELDVIMKYTDKLSLVPTYNNGSVRGRGYSKQCNISRINYKNAYNLKSLSLKLGDWAGVPDIDDFISYDLENLTLLTNLEKLKIRSDIELNVLSLTNLKILIIDSLSKIHGIKYLINLNKLSIRINQELYDFEPLPINLKHLDIIFDNNIKDEHLSKLTNLDTLCLHWNHGITDHGISVLTDLVHLQISENTIITDHAISLLTNLRYLDVETSNIGNKGIINLTNLTYLDASSSKISNDGIKNLTNLIKIRFYQSNITDISHLTKLI